MKIHVRSRLNLFAASIVVIGSGLFSGCHSYHIEATVENRTGAAISLLEVDYPSASFGVDTLAQDGVYHHRIQTRDSGPISVQYMAPHRHSVQAKGPTLYEKQQGSIDIVLLPDGKVEFHPSLQPQQ